MYLSEIKSIIYEKTGYVPKSCGSGFLGRCPAHDDRTPSLSLATGEEGCVLLKCHTGCTIDQICASLQIDKKDLFTSIGEIKELTQTTIYTYQARDGKPLYRKTRIEPGKEGQKKDFYLSTHAADGNWIKGLDCSQRVLYYLPEVMKAIEERQWVFLVEGEKNVEDLRLYGLTATTPVEGAGSKWKEEYTRQLDGAKVALLYDEDRAGHKRRDEIIHALSDRIDQLKVIGLPGLEFRELHGLDVSDWLNQGNTAEALLALVESVDVSAFSHSPCRTINLEDFLALELPQRELILKPFLPKQGLCLLYAKRGVGKTHVALNIAYAVATGALS